MKKRKILLPLLGAVSVGATVVPLATLASCGKKEEPTPEDEGVVVPVEDMNIENGVFEGLKEGTDVTQYDLIKLPEEVTQIADNAFSALQDSNCSIAKVVFPSSLTNIGNHAFTGCASVNEFDFSAMSIQSLAKLSFNDAFANMIRPDGRDVTKGQGYIVYPDEEESNEIDLKNQFKIRLCQEGKLPGEWFRVEDTITEGEWEVTNDRYTWTTMFESKSSTKLYNAGSAAMEYVKDVNANPAVFIDDYLFWASNYFGGTTFFDKVNVTISNVQFTTAYDRMNPLATWKIPVMSFDVNVEMSWENADGSHEEHTALVEFVDMPILMHIDTATGQPCISFDFNRLSMTGYDWPTAWTSFKITIDGDRGFRTVNSPYTLDVLAYELAQTYGRTYAGILMEFLYYDFNIPSHYFERIEIETTVQKEDLSVTDTEGGTIINGFNDATLTPSLYDTLDLSIYPNANGIRASAFEDAFGYDAASTIRTVIFPSQLKIVGESAFASSAYEGSTIKTLDFSKMDWEKIDDVWFVENAFGFRKQSEYVDIKVSNSMSQEVQTKSINELSAKLYQAGLDLENINPQHRFTQVNDWDVWDGGGWTARMGLYNWFPETLSPDKAIQEYAYEVNYNPYIFMDDVLNAYANVIDIEGRGNKTLKLSMDLNTIKFTADEDGNVYLSFAITMIDNDGTKTSVDYKNVPVGMETPQVWTDTDSGAALKILDDVLDTDSDIWTGEDHPVISVSVNGSDPQIIDNYTDFHDFRTSTDEDVQKLYAAMFTNAEIASHYFTNVNINMSNVPQRFYLTYEDDANNLHINGFKDRFKKYATHFNTLNLNAFGSHIVDDDAFQNLFIEEEGCKITKIVGNIFCKEIGAHAFAVTKNGCTSSIKCLDFSNLNLYWDTYTFGEGAFEGFSQNGDGELLFDDPGTEQEVKNLNTIENRILQTGKLSANWLKNGFNSNKQWVVYEKVNDDVVLHTWQATYSPIEGTQILAPDLIKLYLQKVSTNPSIFTDDLLYTYSNPEIHPLDPYTHYEISVSDIVVNEDSTVSFTLGFKTTLNEENRNYSAKYSHVPLDVDADINNWYFYINLEQAKGPFTVTIFDANGTQYGVIDNNNWTQWRDSDDVLDKTLYNNFIGDAYIESNYMYKFTLI